MTRRSRRPLPRNRSRQPTISSCGLPAGFQPARGTAASRATREEEQPMLSRRHFIAASTLALATTNLRAAGANDAVRVAVIGCGGKGGDHIEQFRKINGVRIAALCDVDPARLADRAKKLDDN